jgi:hypothetical protein
MRRTAARLPGICLLLLAAAQPGAARAAGPPHAWLFGAWTGGLFPAPSNISAQTCLGEPTVIFTRDAVLRATLTEVTYVQRVIVTARTNPGVTDFQFSPAVDALAATSNGLLGMDPPKEAPGFGCETTDVLHVERRGENEIVFPGCKDFPNPLIRCPSR